MVTDRLGLNKSHRRFLVLMFPAVSFDVLNDLNWWAVIVSAVAIFALGSLWFLPKVFGDAWMRSIGWTPSNEDGGNPVMYLLALVSGFVIALAVAMVASATGSDTFGEGAVVAIVLGIGITAAMIFITSVFSPTFPKPWTWFAVMGSYFFVSVAIAAIITALWT